MKPAAGTTVHACQGSTYQKICIDMDTSSSQHYRKHPMAAKPFLRHAHYVAASRVTSLEGLHILNWNEDVISISTDVQQHLDYLHNEKPVELCYTPVYKLQGLMKFVYLNTRSLQKHIGDIKSSHSITESDVVILAETQLKEIDRSQDYQLLSHSQVFRNDQVYTGTTRPTHGMITYVCHGIRVLEQHKYTSELFEAVYFCLHKQTLPEPFQIIGIYVSLRSKFQHFQEKFEVFLRDVDTTSCPTVILGDFNMKSVTNNDEDYNDQLERYMQHNYNMKQYIQQPTHDNESTLDLCFSTQSVLTSVIWNHWSDHSIVAVSLEDN